MPINLLSVLLLFIYSSCGLNAGNPYSVMINNEKAIFFLKPENPYPVIDSIPLPPGFNRIESDSNSFAAWLDRIPLKKDKLVHLYDGSYKVNQNAQFAVLNISVGKKDLQQCADAVMRLRAEYLFSQKRFDQINFTDNEGAIYQLTPPYNRPNFDKYLEKVFGMCGTASLSKQLKPTHFTKLQAGDVFVRGGFPGHAVIVVDCAINKQGKKIFLLAQSYMPAQEIHILINPNDQNLSPWYEVNDDEVIETPEYSFYRTELKEW